MANYSEEQREMAMEMIFDEEGWERPHATWFRCCALMGMRPPPKAPSKKFIKAIVDDEEWALQFYHENRINKNH